MKDLTTKMKRQGLDDNHYLTKDFHIRCYDSRHNMYSMLSYIFIIIYGIGIPGSAFYFLYNYRNRLYSSNSISSLKFLYIEYSPNRYYWEMVIMFRKIAIIFMYIIIIIIYSYCL